MFLQDEQQTIHVGFEQRTDVVRLLPSLDRQDARREESDAHLSASLSLPFFERLEEILDKPVGYLVVQHTRGYFTDQRQETVLHAEDIAMARVTEEGEQFRQERLLIVHQRPARFVERIETEKQTVPYQRAQFRFGFVDRVEDERHDLRLIFTQEIR